MRWNWKRNTIGQQSFDTLSGPSFDLLVNDHFDDGVNYNIDDLASFTPDVEAIPDSLSNSYSDYSSYIMTVSSISTGEEMSIVDIPLNDTDFTEVSYAPSTYSSVPSTQYIEQDYIFYKGSGPMNTKQTPSKYYNQETAMTDISSYETVYGTP